MITENELPKTFEDLIKKAQAYHTANPTKFYLGTSNHWADSYFMQFAYSAMGFRPFGPNGNDSSAVGFANAVNALTWMRDTLKPVVTGNANHDSQNAGAKFEAGELPFIIAGPWNVEAYLKAGIEIGVTNIPTINGQQSKTFAGAILTAVYKYTKQPESAAKFVEFMNSDIAMNLLYKIKNKLPALKTELLSDEIKKDAILMGISKQLETAIPMPTIPSVQSYWGPGESMIKAIWNDGKDINLAVVDAEKGYKALEGLS